MRKISIPVIFGALLIGIVCGQKAEPSDALGPKHGRLTVVTTIFPVFDIARSVSGGKADVSMLVPPGVEPHEFEPRPADIIKVHNADLFIYSGPAMERWVRNLPGVTGGEERNLVNVAEGINFSSAPGSELDPHIWLDFSNAMTMSDNIAAAFAKKDPANARHYRKNSDALKGMLLDLDAKYARGIKRCEKSTLVHGGHNSFGYLARRYGLRYEAAVGGFRDAEPSPTRIAFLARLLRDKGIKYVLYDRLDSPALANALAGEVGAQSLAVSSAHTVARHDFERGTTFIAVMENNLEQFRKALECRN